MTSAALCKGYGGLELAAEAVLGPMEHLWYAEHDPAEKVQHAAAVCAAHWPDVPNLGDLTTIDWTAVPRVDVLTAGFPCTDVSPAGKRAGLKPGTRTGIWSHIAHGIGVLRPRLVLLENVEGLLSGRAHSDVEPCPWCLGDVDPELVVRALGAVLADLADLGFDAEWTTVAASDVGAPHRRRRVFIVAWPSDCPPDGVGLARRVGDGAARADGLTLLPTPAARDWKSGESNIMDRNARPLNEVIVNLLPTPTVADSRGSRNATAGRSTTKPATHSDGWTLSDVAYAGKLLPTPMAADGGSDRASSAGFGLRDTSREIPDRWGPYAPAIARWEAVTGRTAPSPTEPGANGRPRLSPPFVEWLMGLPAGWVTDHLGRGQALKCLGNGVVWQQAAHAYAELLGVA